MILKDKIYKTKSRFECGKCKKKWSSSNTTMLFNIYEMFVNNKAKGKEVHLKVLAQCYNQQCKSCGKYGTVDTYESEIERVTKYLCYRIARYYEFNLPEIKNGD